MRRAFTFEESQTEYVQMPTTVKKRSGAVRVILQYLGRSRML